MPQAMLLEASLFYAITTVTIAKKLTFMPMISASHHKGSQRLQSRLTHIQHLAHGMPIFIGMTDGKCISYVNLYRCLKAFLLPPFTFI
jgi:hypothetical protein